MATPIDGYRVNTGIQQGNQGIPIAGPTGQAVEKDHGRALPGPVEKREGWPTGGLDSAGGEHGEMGPYSLKNG